MMTPANPERPTRPRRRRLYDPLPTEGTTPEPAATDRGPAEASPGSAGPGAPPPGAPSSDAGSTPASSSPAPSPGGPTPGGHDRQAQAARIIRWHAAGAAGLGVVPGLGAAGVLALQVRMLRGLARLYGVSFAEHRDRPLLVTFGAGLGAMAAGTPAVAALLGAVVPGLVPVVAAGATTASSTTYAMGQAFARHFERGGTLLDFAPFRRTAPAPGTAPAP